MYGYSAEQPIAIPIYTVLPYCVIEQNVQEDLLVHSILFLFLANDWTLYPFSTQNWKDYYNLMSVYMDSVFYPLLREVDFRYVYASTHSDF